MWVYGGDDNGRKKLVSGLLEDDVRTVQQYC